MFSTSYENVYFKGFPRRMIKYFVKRHLIMLKILKRTDTNEVLLQRFINFLIKPSGGAVTRSMTLATQDNSAIMQNQKLPEELFKPVIRKFEKQKVYSSLIDKVLILRICN